MTGADLFTELSRHVGVKPDSRGEVHITCPNCGKEAQRGSTHFSFGDTGGHCFVCGYGTGLRALAERLGLGGDYIATLPVTHIKPKVEVERPLWWGKDVRWYRQQYAWIRPWALKQIVDEYKPLSEATITDFNIGHGTIPGHSGEFIILPVFDAGGLVNLRGRRIDDSHGPKWVAASGFRVVDLPLFGIDLVSRDDDAVLIIENPYDVAALSEVGVRAVATYSASYWRNSSAVSSRWTREIINAVGRHTTVIIAQDHDLAGNGGGQLRQSWVQQWRAERGPKCHPPAPCGPQIATMLANAGVKVAILDWAELGLPRKSGGWELKEKIEYDSTQTN